MDPSTLATSLRDDGAFRDRALHDPSAVVLELGLTEVTVSAAAALVGDIDTGSSPDHRERAALFALLAAVR